ncbi:hypothetical protein CPC08DRAFT_770179 [Agrocybe pediades]|nr:hypothetical protein CPC08DRAFT_770179 [Agrocybe pediades]
MELRVLPKIPMDAAPVHCRCRQRPRVHLVFVFDLDLHSILETQSIDSGMHNHPVEAVSDDSESVLPPQLQPPPLAASSSSLPLPQGEAPPTSPIVGTPPTTESSDSPIEAYICDPDQDMSLSRSPSPIRYAWPDSAGLFLSDTDLDMDLEDEIAYAPGPSAYDKDDAHPMANADEEDETYKTPGITLSKVETTITSTVTVTRPPSSSVSTPFSGFSITGKSKNKDKDKKRRAMSVTTPSTGSTTDGFGDKPRLIVRKTYEGHEGGHDVGGWVDLRNADDDDDDVDELDEDGVRVKRGRKRSSGGARRASLDEGEVVVVTTKRVKREVDVDRELWAMSRRRGWRMLYRI